VRTVRREWRSLRLGWRAGLRRLPFFTQRTAVLLVGVLAATLAMLGGVVALVGWPGSGGPTHLVPGEQADRVPESRPAPGSAAPGAGPGPGDRSGAAAGGAAASPSPAAPAGVAGRRPAARSTTPGGAATGAQGSGGAAGAGAGGPPAAPPTTSPPTTTTVPPGPLDPVDDLLGPVVSTLLP
jgi:hypothetical protein